MADYGSPLGTQAPGESEMGRRKARAGTADPFKVADSQRSSGESRRPAKSAPTKRSTDDGTSVFKSYEARQANQIEKESG